MQAESGGRMRLGVGRGDSALTLVGERPATQRSLEDFLIRVQAYLCGDLVDYGEIGSRLGLAALGLERSDVVGASKDADPTVAARARRRFAAEVLPGLRD